MSSERAHVPATAPSDANSVGSDSRSTDESAEAGRTYEKRVAAMTVLRPLMLHAVPMAPASGRIDEHTATSVASNAAEKASPWLS